MKRKEFLSMGCKACLLGMASLTVPALSHMALAAEKPLKLKADEEGKIIVPLAELINKDFRILRVKGWMYDVGVKKNEDETYHALLLQCTHMDNQLNVSKTGLYCGLHGSLFGYDGAVIKGPASVPLTIYTCTVAEQNLIIETNSN